MEANRQGMSPGAGDELRRPAHPERRAVEVGQRRRAHSKVYTVYAIEGRKAIVCQAGEVDSVDGYVHKGDSHCCYESVSVLADCELLPDVPAAAPLAADTPNKALPKWTMTALDPGSQRMADQLQKYINEIYQYAQPSYFIPANTWTPPLAAQPAETHKCEFWCGKKSDAGEWLCGCNHADNAGCACPCHAQQAETKLRCPGCQTPTARLGGFCSRSCEKAKPAPQPAPAKCIDCGPTTSPLTMRIVGKRPALSWCDPCYLNYERTLSVLSPAQSGTPYTGPERLERPKLAHSSTWADECEDVR